MNTATTDARPVSPADPTRGRPVWRFLLSPASPKGKWGIILLWVVVMAASAGAASRLESVQSTDPSASRPADSQSALVAEALKEFPEGDTIPAVIVYERPSGLTQEDLERISSDRERLVERLDLSSASVPPVTTSDDGAAALVVLPLPGGDEERAVEQVGTIRADVGEAVTGDESGLRVAVTGGAGVLADLASVFDGVNTTLLLATAAVVALLLLVTYRSPFLWLIPLVAVVVGDYLSRAGMTWLIETFGTTIDGQTAGITLVLVFGVGTDYALLLISRYREELRRHEDRHIAMAFAMRGAGEAVLASATTVAVGLLCLLAASIGTYRGLGPAGAVGVLCAVLATLTLLPALMVVVGRWVFWPFVPRVGSQGAETNSVWARIGRVVGRRPRPVWIAGLVVLSILALGLLRLDLGLSLQDNFRGDAASVDGQAIVAQHFPEGQTDQTVILVSPGSEEQALAAAESVPGVAQAALGPANGTWSQILVTLDADPQSEGAYDTVRDLRSELAALPETAALVGGETADNLDFDTAQEQTRNAVVPLVLVSVFLLLCLFLRSIVAPMVLLSTTVLSYAAALGVTAIVSSAVFGYERFDVSLPLFAFVFLVALGVDYNIFLAVRAREEAAVHGTRIGMLKALAVTGGVITSAGVVLAATFTVLGILPFVALAQLGLAVALGVLLDTLLVRTLVVPGIVVDLGKRAWWRSALSRDGTPEPRPGSLELMDAVGTSRQQSG